MLNYPFPPDWIRPKTIPFTYPIVMKFNSHIMLFDRRASNNNKKRSSKRSEIAIDISQNLKPKPQPEIPILTFECATHLFLFRLPKAKAVGEGKQQPSAYVQVQRIQRLFVLVINIQTSTRRKKGGKRSTVEKQHQNILPLGPPILAGKGGRGGKCAAKEKG